MNSVFVGNRAVTPSKIVCVGRNYSGHIRELHNAVPEQLVVFMKPNSAISRNLSCFHTEQLHYEAEICFIFSENRLSAVGFGLDLTKRALQSRLKSRGLPWERAKAFDGSAVFSRFVSVPRVPLDITLELTVDDKIVQIGGTSEMLFTPKEILAEIQTFIQLNDGDIIMTGTPSGTGPVSEGSVFRGRIALDGTVVVTCEWTAVHGFQHTDRKISANSASAPENLSGSPHSADGNKSA